MDEFHDSTNNRFGDSPPVSPSKSNGNGQDRKKNNEAVMRIDIPNRDKNTEIGRTSHFEATPQILHFTEIKPGEEYSHDISIINISSKSQNLVVVPPIKGNFHVDYEKRGSLAPGLSQKLTIKFRPSEYKYYNDYLRIRGEEKTLLIPLHGYPVINNISFPAQLSFGKVPLCEPVTKTISLKCSIPVNFHFKIHILKPHPYFHISPTSGVISANESAEISVTFNPYTLGSSVVNLKLDIGQYGFLPLECNVSAIAVSGLIESSELLKAEARVLEHVIAKSDHVNSLLSRSSFRSDLRSTEAIQSKLRSTIELKTMKSSKQVPYKSHNDDPVAALLASTFRASDISSTFTRAVGESTLINSKVPNKSNSSGLIADGLLTASIPVQPRGPGSGAVFDAGTHWMTMQLKKKNKTGKSKSGALANSNTITEWNSEDRTIEGLRIPADLDNVGAVNFVLTQEPGKLKPKDLKAAIERNRADKELRAEEQRKIREAGGAAGSLDLRGILADERLNLAEGDPFKRQLREMAFLADVDDVNKQEIEKSFRVSEEFLGSEFLSEDDITVIVKQRSQASLHNKRTAWRSIQGRQQSEYFPPFHAHVRAGATASVAKTIVNELQPLFDANRNDVWGKRMNTLRRFISLVGRWLLRRRVTRRMGAVSKLFKDNGVFTKEQVKEFIAQENLASKAPSASSASSAVKGDGKDNVAVNNESIFRPANAATYVCALPNPAIAKREANSTIISNVQLNPNHEMIKRILFPSFVAEEGTVRKPLDELPIDKIQSFDDNTFFQLKIKPEYVELLYSSMKVPQVPLFFPANPLNKPRKGAYEENALRPAADAELSHAALVAALPPCPPALSDVLNGNVDVEPGGALDCAFESPSWLTTPSSFSCDELDYFKIRHEYRTYMPEPHRCEMDDDWVLRPYGKVLQYDEDDSLRTSLLKQSGFLAANTYLLGSVESRSVDPFPPPGPTISDYYSPDEDRHASGLNCYFVDHTRSLYEKDPEVGDLQSKLDNADILTDSESDDEGVYVKVRPSLAVVRSILDTVPPPPVAAPEPTKDGKGAAKGAKGGKDAGKDAKAAAPAAKAAAPVVEVASAAPATNDTMGAESFSVLNDEDRKWEQVELLRDRKILDHERLMWSNRKDILNEQASRLVELSKASKCPFQALPVQLPFHSYEEALYPQVEHLMPVPLQTFVEQPLLNSSMLLDTGSLGPLSPMKL